MRPSLADAQFSRTLALPSGGDTSYTTPLDIQINATSQSGASAGFVGVSRADVPQQFELEIDIPALTTGQLPDGESISATVQTAVDQAFSSPIYLATPVLITGAGGVGASAVSQRFRLPVETTLRYVRLAVTASASAAATSATLSSYLYF